MSPGEAEKVNSPIEEDVCPAWCGPFVALRLARPGCRRIAAIFNDEGHPASVVLVTDLMRGLELAAIQRKVYKRTIYTRQAGPGFRPRQSPPLVGDITYLRTGQGCLYLATMIDLATRKVLGWQTAEHMCPSLVVDALEIARTQGQALVAVHFY